MYLVGASVNRGVNCKSAFDFPANLPFYAVEMQKYIPLKSIRQKTMLWTENEMHFYIW